MLDAGGSAADAAIAAALVLGVASPAGSGLGGGGFALVYSARTGSIEALDFREVAPAAIDARAFEAPETEASRGVFVGVPGEPLGLESLLRRYGRRALGDDARHAIALAERGFSAGRYLASAVNYSAPRLRASPDLAALFLPAGAPITATSAVRRGDLARTLARFGAEGARPFYTGDLARAITVAARAHGSSMQPSDLAAYRVRERTPLVRFVGGRTIATMPAPSAGGLMVQELATMFASGDDAAKLAGFGSSAYLHAMAEAMRGAFADRMRIAGDPDVDANVSTAYDRALDAAQLAARRARIDPARTHASPEFRLREAGTTHILVTDAEGNVVAVTTTINGPFGARIVVPGTGIVLNDELDDFSRAADAAPFAFGPSPNRPRPGARPVSSMSPTIVFEGGLPVVALGGAGGQRIATGVSQALLARLLFNLEPSACVSTPRVHVGPGRELFVDPEIAADVRAGLAARGEEPRDEVMRTSSVQMIAWERSPRGVRILAASDPRKHGLALAR